MVGTGTPLRDDGGDVRAATGGHRSLSADARQARMLGRVLAWCMDRAVVLMCWVT